ncbi:MAG: ABC transporter permease [Clostridiales bacterium]|nr:ABC transporter permease [Clostridiales bacterium]
MTLKAYCSNIIGIIKRQLWLVALWFALLLLALPVHAAMVLQEAKNYLIFSDQFEGYASILLRVFGSQSILLAWLMMGMAFISALVFGSFMLRQKQVDFYHSQPISRQKILLNNTVAGLLSLLIPYIANLLLTLVVSLAMGAGGDIPWGGAVAGIAIHMLYSTAIFATVLIAVVISGKVAVAAISGVFLLSLLPALLGLGLAMAEEFYPTFYHSLYNWELIIRWLSPAAAYGTTYMSGLPNGILPIIIYDTLALGTALLLFKRRLSEAAGQAIAFTHARPLLKYAMAMLAASVFALVFYSIGRFKAGDYFWWYFGAITGGLLATQITEIVYALDFKAITHNLRGLAIFLVLYLGLTTCAINDVSGFNTAVPQVNKVVSAQIIMPGVNNHDFYYDQNWASNTNYSRGRISNTERSLLARGPVSSPEAIAAAVNIATNYVKANSDVSEEQLSQWRREGKQYLLDYVNKDYAGERKGFIDLRNTTCKVVFTLQNGSKMARDYSGIHMPIQFMLNDLSAIYGEEDHRAAQIEYLCQADEHYIPDRLELFELYYELPSLHKSFTNEDRNRLLAALRSDMLESTLEQRSHSMPCGVIYTRLFAEPMYFPLDLDSPDIYRRPHVQQEWPIYTTFTNTMAFLAEKGFGAKLMAPQLQDIISISLVDYYSNRHNDMEKFGYDTYTVYPVTVPYGAYTVKQDKAYADQNMRSAITDPQQIEKSIAATFPAAACRYNSLIDIDYSMELEVSYKGPGGQTYVLQRVFPY